MKLVVTGCSGYVGTALVNLLLADPAVSVVGVDRVEPDRRDSRSFSFVECDLSSPGDALRGEVFDGIDAVVHLAAARGDWAISDKEYWRDNVAATSGLLAANWATRVPHWLFMSSVAVYGSSPKPLIESEPCVPVGAYGQSKLASEQIFASFVAAHDLRGCAIRPSAVFSPGHPSNTNVYKLIESLRGFPFLPLIGGGKNRKTLTYLPNLLDLITWCLARMRDGHLAYATYNYVEEPVQTVVELISTLRSFGIVPARCLPIPLSLALAASYPIVALARLAGIDLRVTPERVRKFAASTWYDSSQVRRDGFVPRVSLTDALRLTAQWHLSGKPQP